VPEIEIRGAGPVGCALALALGQKAKLVGARDRAAPAFRPIALSYGSRLILERVGAWGGFAATPIRSVHVSQQGAFGRTRMDAADAGVPELGYVVDYRDLLNFLLEKTQPGEKTDSSPSLTVHAEGISDEAEEKSYGQEAVLARVATRPASSGTAWERFTPQGPLALLPYGTGHGGDGYALVWGTRPAEAQALCALPEAEFLAALSAAFGARAGEFTGVSERTRAPLALRFRRSRVAPREAFIGNAAQTLHPVAGQGLNLGLRDAWDLAQLLRDAADPGDARLLERFAATRKFDAAAAIRVTDFLAGAFLERSLLAAGLRGFALTALDICLPARRFFARRMIFGTSAMP
jgi:2-octaprenyl-6-methoxyphenol hydroxylase